MCIYFYPSKKVFEAGCTPADSTHTRSSIPRQPCCPYHLHYTTIISRTQPYCSTPPTLSLSHNNPSSLSYKNPIISVPQLSSSLSHNNPHYTHHTITPPSTSITVGQY
ncbi:hypothetical protein OTU49_002375 [Cherax quadricarinatus]|uniref:Uncharacterized protein n=1 Tax=Cherax quadricarinatus TaxID=27406 RepID=A0AAW0XB70_CHEQU